MIEQFKIWFVTVAAPKLDAGDLGVPVQGKDEDALLVTLLNLVYLIAGVAAVISIIMGGFWYVTSNGEADKIKRGKNAIIFASIGLVVILLAFGITGFVSDRISV